jgi:hypothetical protein
LGESFLWNSYNVIPAKAGIQIVAFSTIQVDSRSCFSGCRIKSGMTENYGLSR